jgi:hypothetical protein
VLLRPRPYRASDRLVQIGATFGSVQVFIHVARRLRRDRCTNEKVARSLFSFAQRSRA